MILRALSETSNLRLSDPVSGYEPSFPANALALPHMQANEGNHRRRFDHDAIRQRLYERPSRSLAGRLNHRYIAEFANRAEALTGMDVKVVPLSWSNNPPRDGLSFVPRSDSLDLRLVALVRLLARQAADDYCDQQAAAVEYQPRR